MTREQILARIAELEARRDVDRSIAENSMFAPNRKRAAFRIRGIETELSSLRQQLEELERK